MSTQDDHYDKNTNIDQPIIPKGSISRGITIWIYIFVALLSVIAIALSTVLMRRSDEMTKKTVRRLKVIKSHTRHALLRSSLESNNNLNVVLVLTCPTPTASESTIQNSSNNIFLDDSSSNQRTNDDWKRYAQCIAHNLYISHTRCIGVNLIPFVVSYDRSDVNTDQASALSFCKRTPHSNCPIYINLVQCLRDLGHEIDSIAKNLHCIHVSQKYEHDSSHWYVLSLVRSICNTNFIPGIHRVMVMPVDTCLLSDWNKNIETDMFMRKCGYLSNFENDKTINGTLASEKSYQSGIVVSHIESLLSLTCRVAYDKECIERDLEARYNINNSVIPYDDLDTLFESERYSNRNTSSFVYKWWSRDSHYHNLMKSLATPYESSIITPIVTSVSNIVYDEHFMDVYENKSLHHWMASNIKVNRHWNSRHKLDKMMRFVLNTTSTEAPLPLFPVLDDHNSQTRDDIVVMKHLRLKLRESIFNSKDVQEDAEEAGCCGKKFLPSPWFDIGSSILYMDMLTFDNLPLEKLRKECENERNSWLQYCVLLHGEGIIISQPPHTIGTSISSKRGIISIDVDHMDRTRLYNDKLQQSSDIDIDISRQDNNPMMIFDENSHLSTHSNCIRSFLPSVYRKFHSDTCYDMLMMNSLGILYDDYNGRSQDHPNNRDQGRYLPRLRLSKLAKLGTILYPIHRQINVNKQHIDTCKYCRWVISLQKAFLNSNGGFLKMAERDVGVRARFGDHESLLEVSAHIRTNKKNG